MKKACYIIRTNLASIFTIILLIPILILSIMLIFYNENFVDITFITSATIFAILTFLYKLLKNIEVRNISFRKKKIKVIEESCAEQFERNLNKELSKLADDGYEIYEVKEVEKNRIHIYYFAKLNE